MIRPPTRLVMPSKGSLGALAGIEETLRHYPQGFNWSDGNEWRIWTCRVVCTICLMYKNQIANEDLLCRSTWFGWYANFERDDASALLWQCLWQAAATLRSWPLGLSNPASTLPSTQCTYSVRYQLLISSASKHNQAQDGIHLTSTRSTSTA